MASDNDDSRRNRDRLDENNPFIAFRRFADSQVSSLLNTVFTLPTTIANYRNVHVAREQCLFGRADKDKCNELHDLEEKARKLLAECREMYRAGNLEGALAKGEEMIHLNYAADMVRKQILDNGRGGSFHSVEGSFPAAQEGSNHDLVEKVANQKGQQWGWSWDWGFPRPFDAEEDASSRHDRYPRWCHQREESAFPGTQAEKRRDASEEVPWPREWPIEDKRWPSRQPSMQQFTEQIHAMFQDIIRREEAMTDHQDVVPIAARGRGGVVVKTVPLPSREDASTITEMARAAGVPRDAYEDLLRTEQGLPLIPTERLGQSDHLSPDDWVRRFSDSRDRYFTGPSLQSEYPKRISWEGEETAEEPSYEYSHDHEDQHDEPPSPRAKQGAWSKDMPETEMEAYERLLSPATGPGASNQTEERHSVLSTLTTTERTVAPDGTVTTKVVLKKRFSDGREESSETVHTQRGQEDEPQVTNRWPQKQEADVQHKVQDKPNNNKKTGWFWSS
ncbi:hypothetical protein BU23DRAFT_558270 [Bimuria novae-zelandiae CBS 107.79]|uniref:Uncharacterized protein n=1 Tax=Bimuria novae-zelandiae CBS 107.79 TaxID=1447943 RepID=A0A6A5UVI4_9PLEO|nr:hypothetical protein BU23DRAFT_558270 [Bimuria novae-zelandiae CBS 107.79]